MDNTQFKKTRRRNIFLAIILLVAVSLFVAILPPVRERIAWRLDQWYTQIFYSLNPPEEVVFVPHTSTPGGALPTHPPSSTPSPVPSSTPTVLVPEDTATPTITPTPLPSEVALSGVPYIDQHGLYNYCAPANLAMALAFWGWPGSRTDIGPVVKPFEEDFNVMPYELADYVTNQTDYSVVLRSGGTLDLLKTLVAGGFPVLIEKGAFMRDLSGKVTWMGHYNIVIGYDDTAQEIIVQDSYFTANYHIAYDEITDEWRSFNNTFMVVYPPDQEERLFALLGDYASEDSSYRKGYEIASNEVNGLDGVKQYFAWFNRGTNMVALKDYYGAAESYDQAFLAYAGLSEDVRPFRILWYETGPYSAYYYTGRYQDVIDLATSTLDAARKPYLEESFVWRARAELALGDTLDATNDFCTSLAYHPGFSPGLDGLSSMGLSEANCP
jgi:hypothetical protein